MSRARDMDFLVPLKARLYNLTEPEARRHLAKMSARELRFRRALVEHAAHPMSDPDFRKLMEGFAEINRVAGKMLAQIPALNLPPHLTVQ